MAENGNIFNMTNGGNSQGILIRKIDQYILRAQKISKILKSNQKEDKQLLWNNYLKIEVKYCEWTRDVRELLFDVYPKRSFELCDKMPEPLPGFEMIGDIRVANISCKNILWIRSTMLPDTIKNLRKARKEILNTIFEAEKISIYIDFNGEIGVLGTNKHRPIKKSARIFSVIKLIKNKKRKLSQLRTEFKVGNGYVDKTNLYTAIKNFNLIGKKKLALKNPLILTGNGVRLNKNVYSFIFLNEK